MPAGGTRFTLELPLETGARGEVSEATELGAAVGRLVSRPADR